MRSSLVLALVLVCPGLAWAGAKASSFKKETKLGANYWNAQAAVDGDLATAWMVPGESPNRGEWIQIDLPKATVDKIAIYPGWGKSKETYKDHPRVAKLKVDVLCCQDSPQMETQKSTTLEVPDAEGWQELDIEDIAVGNELFGGSIKLWVVDVHSGRDYPNLAVSEVLVILKDEIKAPAVLSATSADLAGMPADAQDDDPKTFWATAPQGATFTLLADGYGVANIGLLAGPKTHARPKKVKVTANDRSIVTELQDAPELQLARVPSTTGYTGGAWGAIKVEVLETFPGTTNGELALAEIVARASSYEGI